METYLISVIEDLVVTAILAGVVISYARSAWGRFGVRVITGAIVAGAVMSVVMAVMKQNTALISTGDWNLGIFSVSFVDVVVMLACAVVGAILARAPKGGKAASPSDAPAQPTGAAKALKLVVLFTLALFVLLRVFYKLPDVINYPMNFGISSDNYLSTDFAVRITGYLLGIAVVVLTCVAIVKAFKALNTREMAIVTAIIVGVVCFVQSMTWCQILIARRIVTRGTDLYAFLFPLTSAVSNKAVVFTLAIMVATIVLAIIVIVMSLRDNEPYRNPAEHRKIKARWRNRRRWAICVIMCLVLSLVTITAVKDYANRGPEIVEAEQVEAVDGKIAVPLDSVDDGHLHRYVYETQAGFTTDSGYTTAGGVGVRFIVIKKPGASAYGVGLDACEICGETGYYERDGQVVCKLCDVVMNINTIGFKGGCNPIPFEYTVSDGYIVIEADELTQYEKTFKS